jgi:tetratricopeptide (TPR) repeat protein
LKKFSLRSASFALAITVIITSFLIAAPAQQPQPADQGKVNESLKKGDDLYKAGKFKEAIEAYKEALNQDPNNDQAVGYIGYSYNKLHDTEQARVWMKRRVDLPGQSPSKKAQVLTDITLLYWDEAHVDIASRLAGGSKNLKPEDVAAVKKLLVEGIDSSSKAVAIAPRSVKGFNLMNLLYRASAAIETDPAVKSDMTAKADEALRKAIQFYEAIPQQPSADLWVVPTLSAINGTEIGQAAHFGAPTKKPSPDVLKDAREGSVIVEVVVGRDGKVRLQRVLSGQGKPGDVALGSARQWEFQPSTFEGHTVQVIETISFPAK